MCQLSIQDVAKIYRVNFYLAIKNNLYITIAYFILIPFIRGIANLDAIHSAECMEHSVALIGMIMLVPISLSERSGALLEVLQTKQIQQWTILLIRVFMALFFLFIVTGAFAFIMLQNHCEFPVLQDWVGTFISEIALGSVGLLVGTMCNSTIIGYLASAAYYLFNEFGYIPKKNILSLFSMSSGHYTTKYWLLGFSMILLVTSIFYVKKRKIC